MKYIILSFLISIQVFSKSDLGLWGRAVDFFTRSNQNTFDEPGFKITVTPTHENAPLDVFKGNKNYRVRKPAQRGSYQGLPRPEIRDHVFERAEIIEEIANWDDFDRDLLFKRSTTKPIDDLIEHPHYNHISREKLELLKDIIIRGGFFPEQ